MCPWNVRFSRALPEGSPYAAREALAALGSRPKDARTLARDLLAMTPEEFSAAFRGSPVKRAKLRGLKRNAAVVLGNIGTAEDADVLTRALDDEDPLVREHATWARASLGGRFPIMSPTVLREGPFRLFFFSREEPRRHVHVSHPDGEAKFWLEPEVALAEVVGLSPRHVAEAETVVRHHLEEVRRAWSRHFGG